jgi:restriction system protein
VRENRWLGKGVGNLVSYDAIRSLLGVMSRERDVSKEIITTTSDFPPLVGEDPFIKPFMPTRLELINGQNLQRCLAELNAITDH